MFGPLEFSEKAKILAALDEVEHVKDLDGLPPFVKDYLYLFIFLSEGSSLIVIS